MTKAFPLMLIGVILFTFRCRSQEYCRLVDPLIGTEQRAAGDGLACGYTYPGAAWPFGMVQFTPSFFTPAKGFVINQLSGAGCAHMGNFPVLPVAGRPADTPGSMEDYPRYRAVVNAHAGYLAVDMEDDVRADMTVGRRSGRALFRFPAKTSEGTVLIGSGVASTFVTDAGVTITSPRSCEGYAKGGEFCGTETPYTIYFAAEFDRDAVDTGTWGRKGMRRGRKVCGRNTGAWFTFDTGAADSVRYRIAVSYVSQENARANLLSEGDGFNFNRFRSEAEKAWNDRLSTIAVTSEDTARLVQFYTHFYRALIHPNLISDVNGDYMGADFKVHRDTAREHYSSFSVWDTYRTQGPLLAMLFPGEASDMMQSLVDFADQAGGLGRWILANVETGIMQGDPTSILISGSYAFGAGNFDLRRAYHHMFRGATVPQLMSQQQEVRPHLSEYIHDGHTFASMSLEYNSADFAIARFGHSLERPSQETDVLFQRSRGWKNIFNPEINWLNSRFPNGVWKDISHDWREGTYVNYFWMVPHDLPALIDTIGGKDVAEKRLDELFRRLDASYHDPWFMSGNEPDFQAPWIYNWTNAPWKTSDVVRRILNEMYNVSPSGLPGNEDLGAMGAWYVFASIGLYPMVPGVGGLSISCPQFEDIELHLPEGKLRIYGGGPGRFIETLQLNGITQSSTWIEWKSLSGGADLKIYSTAEPRTEWGREVVLPEYFDY